MTTEAAPQTKAVAKPRRTLQELLNDPGTTKRFQDMLGKDARSFQQNILTVYNNGKALQDCEPESIIAAAAISASINLSILPSLGQSCIVPYKDDGHPVAQWQIQWKGIVALAHRTQLYSKIHLARIYDGQVVRVNRIEGEFEFNEEAKKSNRVVGYYFYFKLKGSDEKYAYYWSAKECIEHGLRYSKSFQKGNGQWVQDPEFEKVKTVKAWLAAGEQYLTEGSGADAMCAKTIVKNSLNKWGPLETRIKEIVSLDQAAIGADGKPDYIDTTIVERDQAETEKKLIAPPVVKKGQDMGALEKIDWVRQAAAKQGVSFDQFDAWLVKQEGNEDAKATMAAAAWKKVTKKEVAAVEIFTGQLV